MADSSELKVLGEGNNEAGDVKVMSAEAIKQLNEAIAENPEAVIIFQGNSDGTARCRFVGSAGQLIGLHHVGTESLGRFLEQVTNKVNGKPLNG